MHSKSNCCDCNKIIDARSKRCTCCRYKFIKGRTIKKMAETTKQKLRIANKGKNIWTKGRIHTEETKQKMSDANCWKGKKRPDKCGKNNNLWKGGITPENKKIRVGIEFRLWREAVFARDNWTCQKYGTRESPLHPHHIKNFAEHIDLRFAIDNGITLSKKAHMEFHNIYGRKHNTEEQLKRFLLL